MSGEKVSLDPRVTLATDRWFLARGLGARVLSLTAEVRDLQVRFTAMEHRFAALETRFTAMEARLSGIEAASAGWRSACRRCSLWLSASLSASTAILLNPRRGVARS